jgi:hypothetical protein
MLLRGFIIPVGIEGSRLARALPFPFPPREGEASEIVDVDFVGDDHSCGRGSSSELSTPQRVRREL